MKSLITTLFGHLVLASVLEAAEPTTTTKLGADELAAPTAAHLDASKENYNLFNPTPAHLMREMSTDRPDKTESPYTVDAGHYQIEMDLFNFTYDRYDVDTTTDMRTTGWNIAPVNVKMGLLNNVDLQIVYGGYLQNATRDADAGSRDHTSGFGDLTTRVKINLWGNDGGTTAFGVMPFVKAPTSSAQLGNNAVEGGIIFPLAVELPLGWSMGTMVDVNFLKDEDELGSGYETEFAQSVTFGHNIVGNLDGYIEFFSAVNTQANSKWQGTIDVGLTYGVTENIQLDCGCNFGVTRSADDFNPFAGISMRF